MTLGRLLDCFLLSFSFSYYYSLVSFDLLSLVHIFLCPPAIGDDLGTAARTKRWGFLRNREGASHDMEVVGEDKWKGRGDRRGVFLVYPYFPTTGRTGRWGGLGPRDTVSDLRGPRELGLETNERSDEAAASPGAEMTKKRTKNTVLVEAFSGASRHHTIAHTHTHTHPHPVAQGLSKFPCVIFLYLHLVA